MQEYAVSNRVPAVSASPEPLAVLWNPSTTRTLYVTRVEIVGEAGASMQRALIRTSTRGTPGSTVTPDADNSYSRDAAPPSGALLDCSDFTVVPTTQGPELWRFASGAVTGSGTDIYNRKPIEVPPGTGLSAHHNGGTPTPATVTFHWKE